MTERPYLSLFTMALVTTITANLFARARPDPHLTMTAPFDKRKLCNAVFWKIRGRYEIEICVGRMFQNAVEGSIISRTSIRRQPGPSRVSTQCLSHSRRPVLDGHLLTPPRFLREGDAFSLDKGGSRPIVLSFRWSEANVIILQDAHGWAQL